MKRLLPTLAVIGTPLLMLLSWYSCAPAAAPPKLTVVFAGLTNNPVRTRPILAVAGNGNGLHALFGVTNTGTDRYIRFETVAVERFQKGDWVEYPTRAFWPSNHWVGMGGMVWSPGHGTLYAVAWPPGMDTNSIWRLRLSVAYERAFPSIAFQQRITRRFHREIFKPRKFFTMESPTVEPSPRVKLLSVESKSEAGAKRLESP